MAYRTLEINDTAEIHVRKGQHEVIQGEVIQDDGISVDATSWPKGVLLVVYYSALL